MSIRFEDIPIEVYDELLVIDKEDCNYVKPS